MKYTKKLVDKICELITTGEYTISGICDAVHISKETFYQWKATKTDFSDRIKKAEDEWFAAIKVKARSALAISLEKHEYEERKTEFALDKNGKPIKKGETVTKKVLMPNMTAVIYTLNNQDAENFKQRQIIAHTGEDGGPVQTETTIKIGYGKATEDDEAEDPQV